MLTPADLRSWAEDHPDDTIRTRVAVATDEELATALDDRKDRDYFLAVRDELFASAAFRLES